MTLDSKRGRPLSVTRAGTFFNGFILTNSGACNSEEEEIILVSTELVRPLNCSHRRIREALLLVVMSKKTHFLASSEEEEEEDMFDRKIQSNGGGNST